jgi:hypothetical protein
MENLEESGNSSDLCKKKFGQKQLINFNIWQCCLTRSFPLHAGPCVA